MLRVIDLNVLSHRDVEDVTGVDHVFHQHPKPLRVGIDSMFKPNLEAKHPFHETKREFLHGYQVWFLDGDTLVGIKVCTLQFNNFEVSCLFLIKRDLKRKAGLMKRLYLPSILLCEVVEFIVMYKCFISMTLASSLLQYSLNKSSSSSLKTKKKQDMM